MRLAGNIILLVLCVAGFVAWVWKLTHGMPLTLTTGFFTVASFIGIITFGFNVAEELD